MSQAKNPESHSGRKPNRLINEQSPYLRQHAYNPVDWYAWGPEALERAKAENKPIMLSIGYSACHWCHVMERESFENDAIARLINDNFVPIKVDREERPDLDQIYMDAVQLITGRGGWPLTMFLAPDGRPFFGGTYYPPEDRQGMPGFPRILAAVSQAYREKAKEVTNNLEKLTEALGAITNYVPTGGDLKPGLATESARALASHYDSINGGLGQAPKFPNTFVFSLFLRVHAADGDESMAEMVRHTLSKMARGGIYDQIGGGFHRYSVDERWLVPHFEKMLYDNALLARLYLDAGRALNEPEFLGVAREIFDYVLREMTSPEGGFYAAQDADSEGVEGKFFVWTPEQVDAVIGPELGSIAERYFDISIEGNFEDANILHRTIELADAARMFKISEDEMASKIREIRAEVVRGTRTKGEAGPRRKDPGGVERDDDRRVRGRISRAARAAVSRSCGARGRFHHDDDVGRARAQAIVQGRRRAAQRLPRRLCAVGGRDARRVRSVARCEVSGACADAGGRDPRAIYRQGKRRILFHVGRSRSADHAIEGGVRRIDAVGQQRGRDGVAQAARLHRRDERYRVEAERTLKLFREFIEKQPFGFSHMLEAVDLYQRGPTEVVIVGDRKSRGSCSNGSSGSASSTFRILRSSSPIRLTRRPVSFRSRCATSGRSTVK